MIVAIINHLWQSTLFAIFLGLLTLAFRTNGANVRFGLWLAASLKFLIPFAAIVAIGQYLRWESAPALEETPTWLPALNQLAEPVRLAAYSDANIQVAAVPVHWDFDALLVLVWLIGAVIVAGRFVSQWARVAAVLKVSTPLDIGTPFRAVSADRAFEPTLFGIVRPVLILPKNLDVCLDRHEFAALISHEVCHWRRQDNLWALLHVVAQTIFWFHPLVWWLGTRLVAERERACDEAVIQGGNDPHDYAAAILKTCKLYLHRSSLCAAGVSGGSLKASIESIMTNTLLLRLNLTKKLLLSTVCLGAIGLPVTIGVLALPNIEAKASNMLGLDRLSPEARQARDQSIEATAMKRWEQARPRKRVPIEFSLLENYVGHYKLNSLSVLNVTRDGDHLLTQLTGQTGAEAFPESDHDFFLNFVQAQLTFLGEKGQPASSMVLHQNGADIPLARISEDEAKAINTHFAERLNATTPDPSGETALRHDLEARQKGEPDYENMGPELVKAVRNQLPWIQPQLQQLGSIQSIQFIGVDRGVDLYHVRFANGDVEWRVVMDPNGKIDSLNHNVFKVAKRLPLDSLNTFRSERTDQAARMEFINKTNEPYNVYWIGPMGNRIDQGALPANGLKQVQTFATHKWLVGKDDAHPIAAFDASIGLSIATIEQ